MLDILGAKTILLQLQGSQITFYSVIFSPQFHIKALKLDKDLTGRNFIDLSGDPVREFQVATPQVGALFLQSTGTEYIALGILKCHCKREKYKVHAAGSICIAV